MKTLIKSCNLTYYGHTQVKGYKTTLLKIIVGFRTMFAISVRCQKFYSRVKWVNILMKKE